MLNTYIADIYYISCSSSSFMDCVVVELERERGNGYRLIARIENAWHGVYLSLNALLLDGVERFCL